MSKSISVLGRDISMIKIQEQDFICITDIAKYKSEKPDLIIQNRLRNRNTIEFLGLREQLYNSNFNPIEFEGFRTQAWLNAFLMSPKKWIEWVHAIGLVSKSWRYGWTFAHKDIALEFASWISIEFKLYFIKEFQRLKETELKAMDWNTKRFLTKVNYKIHTDAIKSTLIPKLLDSNEIKYIYADEADILNMALFGQTAKEWRDKNPWVPWNMRDEATISQLIVLANLESINAEFIKMNMEQSQRLTLLNQIAIDQMKSLESMENIKSLWNKE